MTPSQTEVKVIISNEQFHFKCGSNSQFKMMILVTSMIIKLTEPLSRKSTYPFSNSVSVSQLYVICPDCPATSQGRSVNYNQRQFDWSNKLKSYLREIIALSGQDLLIHGVKY